MRNGRRDNRDPPATHFLFVFHGIVAREENMEASRFRLLQEVTIPEATVAQVSNHECVETAESKAQFVRHVLVEQSPDAHRAG